MLENPYSVKPEVLGFEPYEPGLSIDEIRERYKLTRVIKMASNENPLGVSPRVLEAIERSSRLVFRYAQSGSPQLVRAIAAHHGVDAAKVVLGNGSDEVIDLLIRCRATPGVHNVLTNKPCFSLYPLQTRLCGVELRQAALAADFSIDWTALKALVDDNTALVFITTPDNPSGYCPGAEDLRSFAAGLPRGALLVLDEAYMDFAEQEKFSLLSAQLPNVAILRTFSKSFGLAGLRLGYGIMPAPLADYLCRVRLPFSINILAEAAGLAALEDTHFREATLTAVQNGREQLFNGLAALGCYVYKSHSNFLMFRLPSENGVKEADTAIAQEIAQEIARTEKVFNALLEQGVIIRRLKMYNLPQYFRVSVGNSEENAIFLNTLKRILE
jgi:histidinol-phosphate aminotransferase